jgi:hypothetical protein
MASVKTTMGRAARLLPSVTIGLMIVVLGSALPCHAQSVPLSDLINGGGEIVHGDKVFDQFTYSFTGDMPGPENVNVVPITDVDENLGLQFQGFFSDLFSSQGGSDALIGYRVTVQDPLRWIVDAHLFGNPELLGDTGTMTVTETFVFYTMGDHQMSIFDDETAGSRNADWTEFAPRQVLHVRKDIGAFAGEDGSVTLTFVDQTFSQIDIPEASTGLLMLIGLACLGAVRWVRRR